MLVLALQFSRGDVGACGTQQGARHSGAGERWNFHSLKTEEKTVTASGVARGRDRIPNNLLLDGRQPTSAPTGVSQLDRTNDDLQSRSTP